MDSSMDYNDELVKTAQRLLFRESFKLTDSKVPEERAFSTDLFRFQMLTDYGELPIASVARTLGVISNDLSWYTEKGEILLNLERMNEEGKASGITYEFSEASPQRSEEWRQKTAEWGKQFLGQLIIELRDVICAKEGEYSSIKDEYKEYPKAFAVAASSAAITDLSLIMWTQKGRGFPPLVDFAVVCKWLQTQ